LWPTDFKEGHGRNVVVFGFLPLSLSEAVPYLPLCLSFALSHKAPCTSSCIDPLHLVSSIPKKPAMQGRVSWFLLVGAGSAAGYSKERSSTPRLDLHLVPGGAPFWLLSGPDPSKRSPAALLGFPAAGPLFSFPKSVPAACVQTCFVSLLVDPFCPLSCPDPSKRGPAGCAWLRFPCQRLRSCCSVCTLPIYARPA
jgi:hypothetical protein